MKGLKALGNTGKNILDKRHESWKPLTGAPTGSFSGGAVTETAFSSIMSDLSDFKAIAPKTVEDFKLIYGDNPDDEAFNDEFVKDMEQIRISPPEHQRKLRNKLLAKTERECRREHERIEGSHSKVRLLKRTYREIYDRACRLPQPFKLEKCKSITTPALKEAFRRGAVRNVASVRNPEKEDANSRAVFSSLKLAQILVIDHDWSAAMARADLDADFKLPYDHVVFEMVIGGHPIVALANGGEHVGCNIGFQCLMADDHGNWMVPGLIEWAGGRWAINDQDALSQLCIYVGSQIRSCCIALDAEVAETSVERVHHLSNRPGSVPVKGDVYHVVSLARRPRAARLPSGGEPSRHVRLHFRRGHWRHFDNHKTWIKWMLVGDPDLGVVEKHYQL